ncbi:hypothetical protein FHR81_000846 [Actinoalloteichus hoggarensis]|uniref:Uncharacterized protein n=1 Tax=Actinoalloteichus hoggarensis TaxID=1470176 RepID=A0A221W115_9PSEU|nr:hypothetical protein [Actinoalloteichus hoggarensis]ASO19477.1 hypothetical protein AHOG_09165 [Actinoalloteichus hoggarensis]MBB5919817.1 hypothetical protein [Actinoalloteichus hoggarensis]
MNAERPLGPPGHGVGGPADGRAAPPERVGRTGCGLWLTAVFVVVAGLLLWQAVTADGLGRLASACGAALLFLAAFATAGTSLNLGSGRSRSGCVLTAASLLLAPGLLLLGGAYAGERSGVIRVLVEVVGWLLVLTWLLVTIIALGLGRAHRFVASVRGDLDGDAPAGAAAGRRGTRPGDAAGSGGLDPVAEGPAIPRASPSSPDSAPPAHPDGDSPAR